MLTFATNRSASALTATKSVTDVNGEDVSRDDRLHYSVTVTNGGGDGAAARVLTDAARAGTTYVPGSLTIGGAAATDATGDVSATLQSTLLDTGKGAAVAPNRVVVSGGYPSGHRGRWASVTVHDLSVDTPTVPLPGVGLAPGASISVAFTFAVETHGTFWFGYDVDATTGSTPARSTTNRSVHPQNRTSPRAVRALPTDSGGIGESRGCCLPPSAVTAGARGDQAPGRRTTSGAPDPSPPGSNGPDGGG